MNLCILVKGCVLNSIQFYLEKYTEQFLRHINISYDFDLKLKMKLYNLNKFESNSN